MKSKVQIVISAINLWDKYTKRCIDSVVNACKDIDYRILFIDNGSNDNTKEEAGKLVSNTFSHKRNEENWGTQRSWNYGIKDAFERGFEYVFVINNDILLHPEAINQIIERFEKAKKEKDDRLVMITCMDVRGECLVPEDVFKLSFEDKKNIQETEHPNFSAFMLNKKCWDEVGEFDELFYPAYFEDNDYHRRIKLAGLKAITYPPAIFYHYGSRTQNEAYKDPIVPSVLFEMNRKRYIDKWGGTPENERFDKPYNGLSNSIKMVKQDINS